MSLPSPVIRGSFVAFRSWVAVLVERFRERRRMASSRVAVMIEDGAVTFEEEIAELQKKYGISEEEAIDLWEFSQRAANAEDE